MAYDDLLIKETDTSKDVAGKFNSVLSDVLNVPDGSINVDINGTDKIVYKEASGNLSAKDKYSIVDGAKVLDWTEDQYTGVDHILALDPTTREIYVNKINQVTTEDGIPLSAIDGVLTNIPGIGIGTITLEALTSIKLLLPTYAIRAGTTNDLNAITEANVCICITGNAVYSTKNIPSNSFDDNYTFITLMVENIGLLGRSYSTNPLDPESDILISQSSSPTTDYLIQRLTMVATNAIKIYYRVYVANTLWGEWSLIKDTTKSTDIINLETQVTGQLAGANIADGAITSSKIANKTITAGNIADDTITATKIAANAVTSSELAANAVVEAKIASNAITTAKIKDASVTDAKLSGVISNAHGGLGGALTTSDGRRLAYVNTTGSNTPEKAATYTGRYRTTTWVDYPTGASNAAQGELYNYNWNEGNASTANGWGYQEFITPIGEVWYRVRNNGKYTAKTGWQKVRASNGAATLLDVNAVIAAIKANPGAVRSALGLGSLATLNSINLSDTKKTTGILPSSRGGFDYQNYLG